MLLDKLKQLGAKLSVVIQSMLPQQQIGRLFGWLANRAKNPLVLLWMKLWWKKFCGIHGEQLPVFSDFDSFNAFFTRSVPFKIDDSASLIAPAEGAIIDAGVIDSDLKITIKYDMLTIEGLLGKDYEWASNGSFAVIYLAPGTYHCVHAPCDATLIVQQHIPGKLLSVNPSIMAERKHLLSSNERVVMHFDKDGRRFALVMVGALVVGGIHTIWENKDVSKTVSKGQKIGEFRLGSTVVLIDSQQNEFNRPDHIKVGEKLA